MSIVECCEKGVIRKLSFEEIKCNTKNLEFFFSRHLTRKSYIGILMTHNIHIPALILSIKNCGHIFIPINISYGQQDIQDLIEEANIEFLLLLNESKESFKDFQHLDDIFLGNDKILLFQRQFERKPCVIDHTLLCILATSGTTGKRKLIKIESYCIEKNVKSMSKIFNLVEKDVIFYGTPLTFDPSLVELFLAIQSKATLIIVPEQVKLNPEKLFQTLFYGNDKYTGITFLQTVPSLFKRWTKKQIQFILEKSLLKVLVLGGEPFPDEMLRLKRNVRLFNVYGITEVSCWATLHEIKDDNEVFLGTPLEETLLKICVNEKELQEGIGELFIGSNTRNCYIDDEEEKKLWRSTGDIVEKTDKGIKYVCRKDYRIKRLGHQIHLNEIENKIFECTELAARCIWYEKHCKLLLFIQIQSFEPSHRLKVLDKLRVKLLSSLHTAEFPDFIDILYTFPVNHNGKLDNRTLIKIYEQSKDELKIKSPSCIFLVMISKYLGHSLESFEKIKEFTFEELGGNSVSYLLITNEFKDTWKCDLPQEFLSLLYSKSLERCLNFLDGFKEWSKYKFPDSHKEDSNFFNCKRIKYSFNVDVLWKFNLFGCVDATPLVFGRRENVYVAVGSFSNFFVILDAITGTTKFFKQFSDSIGSEASVSPCSEYLCFGCFDGNLYCIGLEQFEIIWTYQSQNSIKCKPSYCLNNQAVIFCSYDRHLHCINVKNGHLIWRTFIDECSVTHPIVLHAKGKIIVATISGSCISICERNGVILNTTKLNNPVFGSPVLINDKLILCDVLGNLYSANIESDENISILKVDGEVYSSLRYVKDNLIFGSTKGTLYKCSLTKDLKNCNVAKSVALGSSISSTPTIFPNDGKMVIAVATSIGYLYLIDFETFQTISCWEGPSDIYSSCTFLNSDKLYVGCRDDHLYCLNLKIS